MGNGQCAVEDMVTSLEAACGLADLGFFFAGKRVFVTGHTGFKGSWLCKMLCDVGAEVTGLPLRPPTDPNLFQIAGIAKGMRSVIGDVRDLDALSMVFADAKPEIVLAFGRTAACARKAMRSPRYTYRNEH